MLTTEVRRIAANLESTSAQVATLTGRMHHWGTMPKPELAKVEALELQVRLLMTRLEQSKHDVHALGEEIRTRPHANSCVHTPLPPNSKTQCNTQNPTQDTIRARCLGSR